MAINTHNEVNPETNTRAYCEFDWWNSYDWEINTINQNDGVLCYDKSLIQTKYINVLKNDPNYTILTKPHSDSITCENDCVIYVSHQLNTWKSGININCPNNQNSCSVVWYINYIVF